MTYTVYKNDYRGVAVTSYEGLQVDGGETWTCVRAIFRRGPVDLGMVTFSPGDVFIEWFFTDRWYNIFQVHDGESEDIKGWYCNITRPAALGENWVASDDLELDVFVNTDGRFHLIDENEFQALALENDERMAVLNAVQELRGMVNERQYPFHRIAPR